MASIEQAAANLAAALQSGNAQDAESALASYAEATDGVEDVPEANNGPIKAPLAVEVDEESILDEDISAEEAGLEAEEAAALAAVAEELDVPGASLEGVDFDAVADAELNS